MFTAFLKNNSSYFGFGVPWQLPDLEGSERAYEKSKKAFADDGRRVLDATVEGKLQVFEKIDYPRVVEEKLEPG